jgi:acyl-CoA synthetase (AMP-forming)/AMP-acid ligase II
MTGGTVPRRPLLPDALRNHAARQPDARALVFLDDQGAEEAVLTYGDLHRRSLAVARQLVSRCPPGERAMLLFPPGLDFVVAYFGCLHARVIPVPVSPPRPNRRFDTFGSILNDSEPSAVLTVSSVADLARPFVDQLRGGLHWLAVDQAEVTLDPAFDPRPCSADTIALLQYTSGSTSHPKGVMVSHGNLRANQEMIRRAFGHDQDTDLVGWTPLFHDQGLIGNVLQPIHLGSTSILMSPIAFIRRPLLWLSAISRYRAHTSGGPNFAFDACVAHAERADVVDLDLSCWKVAYDGAEPIHRETLDRFAETFAGCGFRKEALYPCYGLAEATLLVAGSRKGRGPRTLAADVEALSHGRYVAAPEGEGRTLVGSGRVLPEEDIRVVDPDTGLPCPADQVGEIWIAGEHVAQGYWRRPDATAETFHARCDGATGRRYLRTGDLGLVVDGELYVVGRLKDLIIIRGRNYYPQDVERAVQAAHPALRPGAGAAFSVDGQRGEKLVVVQEIRREDVDRADAREVTASIRAALSREHELSVSHLVLTLPGQLERTSSGKIMRAAARKRYLEDSFEVWEPRERTDHGSVEAR